MKPKRRDKYVTTALTEDEHRLLQMAVEYHGIRLSAVARKYILEGLKRDQKKIEEAVARSEQQSELEQHTEEQGHGI